jgi:hypothetical protein
VTHPRDPRNRRAGGAFATPVDVRAAAHRLETAADQMREAMRATPEQTEEPPTGLLDLAAIRAALGNDPGEDVNPAAVRWLAGVKPEVDEDAEVYADPRPVVEQLAAELVAILDEHEQHPYFVEGCAACVAAAEEAERAEEEARAAAVVEEPEPVTVAEEPEPEASPAPAPVAAPVAPVPPPEPAPVAVPVYRSEHAGGRALTWKSRHDERSRAFGVRRGIAVSAPLTDHLWPVGPVLDQGSEGACVGFGIVAALNAAAAGDPDLTAEDARALFARADRIDGDGRTGVGTSVLAGLKAAQERGELAAYDWAFGTKDLVQGLLQRGPAVLGIPWPMSWFDAPADGLLTLDGADVGDLGHCLAAVGIVLSGPGERPGPYVVLQNSYAPSWGAGGFGFVHHRDLARLLRGGGEAAFPTREAPRV